MLTHSVVASVGVCHTRQGQARPQTVHHQHASLVCKSLQDEALIGTLTVRETIRFAAQLRLPQVGRQMGGVGCLGGAWQCGGHWQARLNLWRLSRYLRKGTNPGSLLNAKRSHWGPHPHPHLTPDTRHPRTPHPHPFAGHAPR